jgi:AAA+ ATPase superfamily predicted ATPase
MADKGIIGRDPDLAYLEGLWGRKVLVTCCIWGRRRIGKTSILREFGKGKRMLFLQCIRGLYYEDLSSLSLDISEFLGKEIPQAPKERAEYARRSCAPSMRRILEVKVLYGPDRRNR